MPRHTAHRKFEKIETYYVSKKCESILYSKLLYKTDQCFLDIQYYRKKTLMIDWILIWGFQRLKLGLDPAPSENLSDPQPWIPWKILFSEFSELYPKDFRKTDHRYGISGCATSSKLALPIRIMSWISDVLQRYHWYMCTARTAWFNKGGDRSINIPVPARIAI